MKKIMLLCLAVFLAFQAQASAHSTKGRMKVPLDKDVIAVDDIAYFFESYVHRHLYKDKFEKSENRFYVNVFLGVDQQGSKAVVRFRTLDFKEKTKFDDKASLIRLDSGAWALEVPGQEPLQMYTYVKKTAYYYNNYMVPICSAGLVLGLGVLAFLRFKKSKKTGSGKTIGGQAA